MAVAASVVERADVVAGEVVGVYPGAGGDGPGGRADRHAEADEKIIRLGMPIGSATRPIAAGAWVHTHNLASDYIRTFDHRGGDGHA